MKIANRAAALAAAVTALTGFSLAAAPAHADSFVKSVQNVADDLNLDAFYNTDVLTRDPSLNYQVWQFAQVGTTPEGTGVYLIRGTQYNTCIQEVGVNAPVVQRPCSPNNLSQRWVVNTGQEHTKIVNEKYRDEVLQSNGLDQPVTASMDRYSPTQWWTLYDK